MSRTLPRPVWFLLLAVLALVAAGCGGDDGGGGSESSSASGTSEEAEPLEEDEFLEQFDETCQATNEEIVEVGEDVDQTDNDDLAEAAEEVVGIANEGLEELQGLTPPEDLQDATDEVLSAIEDQIGRYEDLQAAAEDDDDDAVDEVRDGLFDGEDTLDEAGEELGIECFAALGDQSDDLSDDLTSDFSDDFSSDFSDDFSSDFSDDFSSDFSDDLGAAVEPAVAIPEYGSVGALDDAADACFGGDYDTCDRLYFESDPGSGYRDYGDTCGGRQEVGTGVLCVDAFG